MARPREFEPDDAVTKIKGVFWARGFEGTSLQDIEAATGLKKQSLYRLFGDKRGMYLAALQHYEKNEVRTVLELLQAPGPARGRFEAVLARMVDLAVHADDRRGCFLCNAIADQAQLDAECRQGTARMTGRLRSAFTAALRSSSPYCEDRVRAEAKAGALLAGYFGLRVLIAAGSPEPDLRAVVTALVAEI